MANGNFFRLLCFVRSICLLRKRDSHIVFHRMIPVSSSLVLATLLLCSRALPEGAPDDDSDPTALRPTEEALRQKAAWDKRMAGAPRHPLPKGKPRRGGNASLGTICPPSTLAEKASDTMWSEERSSLAPVHWLRVTHEYYNNMLSGENTSHVLKPLDPGEEPMRTVAPFCFQHMFVHRASFGQFQRDNATDDVVSNNILTTHAPYCDPDMVTRR